MIKKLFLLLLALGAVLYWGQEMIRVLATGDLVALKELILRAGYWAPFLSFLLIIIQAFISPLPSVIIFIANGIIFGPMVGFLISWVGSLISALLCFAMIRYLGLALPTPPKVIDSMLKLIEEYQNQAVFVARLLPFVPFDLASYAFALTPLRLQTFLVGTALGQTPAILFYSLWGQATSPWYVNLVGIVIWASLVSVLYYSWQKLYKTKPQKADKAN